MPFLIWFFADDHQAYGVAAGGIAGPVKYGTVGFSNNAPCGVTKAARRRSIGLFDTQQPVWNKPMSSTPVLPSKPPTSQVRTVHVRIEGRVQGVGYRAWCAEAARDIGLTGWVRNRKDGAVEAILQGPSDAIEAMIAKCRQGPHDAAVCSVVIVGEGGGAFDQFEILQTT